MEFDNNFEDNEQDHNGQAANINQSFIELTPLQDNDANDEYERNTIQENNSEHDSWVLKSQQGEQPYSYDKFSNSGVSSPYDIWKGPNESQEGERGLESFRLHKTFG